MKDILKPEVAEALDTLKEASPAEAPERPPTTVRRRKRPMQRPKPVEEIVPEVANGRDAA